MIKQLDSFTTPMMQQYADIKKKHLDCLLFFRLGDFYELFLDDAKIGADVLDITLTKRPRGKDGHIPMAGVPYHVADTYISRLVKAGHKVAICEQVSTPDGQGIVERKVIRIVTPGTLMDEKNLDKKEHNFTLSLLISKNMLGISAADISTGHLYTTEITFEDKYDTILQEEIARFNPKEIIMGKNLYQDYDLLKLLSNLKDTNTFKFEKWEEIAIDAEKFLKNHFKVENLAVFGLLGKSHAIETSATLLAYLQETVKNNIYHISKVKTYLPEKVLVMDQSTIKNLELFTTIHEGSHKNTFLATIDHTVTSMGGRKLRSWVHSPLIEKPKIIKRQNAVSSLIKRKPVCEKLSNTLREIYDLERVLSRLSVGIGNPVDLIHLSQSLTATLQVKKELKIFEDDLISTYRQDISENLLNLINEINQTIENDPPFDPKNGGLIKNGKNKNLDKLKSQINSSKTWLSNLEKKEKDKTGINTLKVRFNKVFGFYIEVSNNNIKSVPKNYIRKQTLVNAERFITDELKKHEEKVLAAEERINQLEYKIFIKTINKTLKFTGKIQKAANAIAEIDCLISLSTVSSAPHFTKPRITENGKIAIISGRHPVVEKSTTYDFVPNDIKLDNSKNQMIIITGPNMAGKSVFIRQVALIVLMAHIGMYVPAKSAEICIVDRIFVRSGASDIITQGMSTFMLEMVESANILNHATNKSLIIMDEVGRGTSTYDGISIAWAIVEYLLKNKETAAKTLFATHYHELTKLQEEYPDRVKNLSMAVKEKNGAPVFLYTAIPGGANASYGIEVAQLAGIPNIVIASAQKKLATLENAKATKTESDAKETARKNQIIKLINKTDVNKTTPIEALNILSIIKEMMNDTDQNP